MIESCFVCLSLSDIKIPVTDECWMKTLMDYGLIVLCFYHSVSNIFIFQHLISDVKKKSVFSLFFTRASLILLNIQGNFTKLGTKQP